METLADVIGKNIKERREALGLSQGKMSREMGLCNNALISSWEAGKHTPSAYMLLQLCRFFGCTIDALFEGAQLDAR